MTGREKKVGGWRKIWCGMRGGSFVQAQRSAARQAELQGELVTAGFGIWRATDLGRSSQWEAFRGTSSRVCVGTWYFTNLTVRIHSTCRWAGRWDAGTLGRWGAGRESPAIAAHSSRHQTRISRRTWGQTDEIANGYEAMDVSLSRADNHLPGILFSVRRRRKATHTHTTHTKAHTKGERVPCWVGYCSRQDLSRIIHCVAVVWPRDNANANRGLEAGRPVPRVRCEMRDGMDLDAAETGPRAQPACPPVRWIW